MGPTGATKDSWRDFSALVYYDPSVHHDLTAPADCFANFSFLFLSNLQRSTHTIDRSF